MRHPRLVRYFKTPPEIIRLAVMMYVRYPWFWWNRLGTIFAAEIRRSRVKAMRSLRQLFRVSRNCDGMRRNQSRMLASGFLSSAIFFSNHCSMTIFDSIKCLAPSRPSGPGTATGALRHGGGSTPGTPHEPSSASQSNDVPSRVDQEARPLSSGKRMAAATRPARPSSEDRTRPGGTTPLVTQSASSHSTSFNAAPSHCASSVKFLNVRAVAARYGVGGATIWRWLKTGVAAVQHYTPHSARHFLAAFGNRM